MNDVAPITLATLIEKIKADTDLAPTRQRDLVSDLKSLARLLDRRPEAVPADLKALGSRINAFHHVQIGMSRKRLQNLRSSVTFVFQRYEITRPGTAPLTPVWQALFDQLQTKRERDGLVSLFRYCAAHRIAPQNVTDAVTREWCAWMQTQTLRKKPKQVYRQACTLWNEIGARGVQAPGGIALPRLTVPSHRAPSFTQPWSAFPRAFVDDVEAYGIWRSGKDLFAHEAPTRACKPSTIDLEKGHIRVLASAAMQQGYPLDGFNSLADLISQDCVKAALGYYQTKLEDG